MLPGAMGSEYKARKAGERLETLERLRDSLERLEKQASSLEHLQEQQEREQLIKASAAGDASLQVHELKQYLDAVCDADSYGDATLRSITSEHCIAFAVKLIKKHAGSGLGFSGGCTDGTFGLLELAAATLCMFSQRPATHGTLLRLEAVPALTGLLNPELSPSCVENAASALGNLGGHVCCRAAVRSGGGIGALVRLLRADTPSRIQRAAASALALLAAHDPVIQDSVRYLGGIDLLVALLAHGRSSVADVARLCLSALKHNNSRNQADILQAVRLSPDLARNFERLRSAAVLLDSSLEGLQSQLALDELVLACGAKLRTRSPARRSASPLRAVHDSIDASIDTIKAGLATSAIRAAARSASAGRIRTSTSSSTRHGSAASVAASISSYGSHAATKQDARGPGGKHLLCYSCDEIGELLLELGFERSEVRLAKRAGLSGAALLAWDRGLLQERLFMPRSKIARLVSLREAAALYDAIATRSAQPRLSEVELRLWLGGQGCSMSEVGRIVKLLRSLVMGEPGSVYITFWEWAAGWQWVVHALETHGVDWHRAL